MNNVLIICSVFIMIVSFTFTATYGAQVYSSHGLNVGVNLNGGVGLFNSERSYLGATLTEPGSETWFEGYGIYGIDTKYNSDNLGTLLGAFNLYSGASQGDPNALGLSVGDEYQTQIEDAYLIWQSNNLIPWLGTDGLKIGAGRRAYSVGTSFIIGGDRIIPGTGLAPGFQRGGGVLYLAGRQSFSNSATIEIGPNQGIHTKIFWLKSNNKFQANESFAGLNVEYTNERSDSLGITYFRGLDVEKYSADIMGKGYRKGQNVGSIYGSSGFGIKQLTIAGQYVYQSKGNTYATNVSNGEAHAWYASIKWNFDQVVWSPSIMYRFSRFSIHYDPMFYGLTSLGTWFQGEVASTYAGPFNTASNIHFIEIAANPSQSLQLGLNLYKFTGTPRNSLNGSEIDMYGWWTATSWLQVIPLIGIYNPLKGSVNGGSQIGGSGPNIYSELILFFSF